MLTGLYSGEGKEAVSGLSGGGVHGGYRCSHGVRGPAGEAMHPAVVCGVWPGGRIRP